MNIQVFVITHKEIAIPKIEGYYPLWVGAQKTYQGEKGYLLDNTGENISSKNSSYCELTGLYWMWKNIKADYIGLVHYRRFFVKITADVIFRTKCTSILSRKNGYEILSLEDINQVLQNGAIIVREVSTNDTVSKFFEKTIGREIIEELLIAVGTERDELLKFLNGHRFVCCNMFISSKEIIDRYCEWLFPILSRVDAIRASKTGGRYCKRELGYLGEILFGFYLLKENIKYTNYHVLDCGKISGYMSIGEYLREKILQLRTKKLL